MLSVHVKPMPFMKKFTLLEIIATESETHGLDFDKAQLTSINETWILIEPFEDFHV